ncbi:CAP domain-containing protein [Aequorivita sp. F47161]|uniref:CAP domain-containing protein n=1 Tax=Aequorivita vitellina TaxID=2874475 RepID=A0A9X1QVW6_9FLAO|nr:CAP domain-containing protein [Aequorivita vitellina]MCG2418332.1 CAP domain-containing protein [Aequorivita vitellina]
MKSLILILCVFFSIQLSFAQNDTIVSNDDVILVVPTQSDTISTGSEVTMEMATQFLAHHNMARNEVGVPDLKWSANLASIAQKHADMLAQDHCSFRHSGNSTIGENLYGGGGTVFTALDASKSWYKEKDNYTYSNSKYNHYTQMVWKSTTEVGVGVAQCEDGFYIFVANYAPVGNMLGSYPY